MEYIILEAVSITLLTNAVQAHINSGWTPLGGVSATAVAEIRNLSGYTATQWSYTQAMTRL